MRFDVSHKGIGFSSPALPSRRRVSAAPECLFNNCLREVLGFPAPGANWGQQLQMCCSSRRSIKERHSNKPAGQSCLWRRESIKAVCLALISCSGRPRTRRCRPPSSAGGGGHGSRCPQNLFLLSLFAVVVLLSLAAEENHTGNQSRDTRSSKV